MVAMMPGVGPFPTKPTASIRRMLDIIPDVRQYEASNENSDNHPTDPDGDDDVCSHF